MGVRVTIDGAETRNVSSGDALRLDSKAHSLLFTCPVCTGVERPVAASEKDDTISVHVPIKPATLVILGPPDKNYHVEGHSEPVHAGSNSIPMNGQFESVTVTQIETHATSAVKLEAGKTAQASF
jgi:hypothetical protein